MEPDALCFKGQALFRSPALLEDILEDLRAADVDSVRLALAPGRLVVEGRGAGQLNETRVECTPSSSAANSPLDILCPEAGVPPVAVWFRQLRRMSRLAKISQRVLLQFGGGDAPLGVHCALGHGGGASLFIAPIDEEEQQQAEHHGD